MPTLKDSRCSVSIPFGATGEDSELCGASASKVCENCGVMCNSCAESFQCPLVSDGKHVFVTPETTPTPKPLFHVGQVVDAPGFTDIYGKEIPAQYGLVVKSVHLIDSGSTTSHAVKPYYRYQVASPSGMGWIEGQENYFVPSQSLAPVASPVRFEVTEPNGQKTPINGTYHTLTFAETLAELDPFLTVTPCWHEDSFTAFNLQYFGGAA